MSATEFYDRLQAELVLWAERLPAIRALIVVGSQAREVKPADEYSDLDVAVFTAGDQPHPAAELYLGWMRDFAPVWMIVEEHHDAAQSWLILYQGGIKVDFSVTPIAELQRVVETQELWDDMIRGYRFLLDKDDLAAGLPSSAPFDPPPYTPPPPDQFQRRVQNFFYGAVYVAKQITRGNLWKAKWADQYQQTFLLEMLEWHAHATHATPVDTYYRGDFMRDWVSESTWSELHQVYAHFDARDSWHALIASIRLFTRLTEETAARLGYTFPRQMMVEVTQYIQALGQKG